MNAKREHSFAGAADLVLHAEAATDYLKEMCAACADGDKSAARASLRRAISELEIARAMLRIGLEGLQTTMSETSLARLRQLRSSAMSSDHIMIWRLGEIALSASDESVRWLVGLRNPDGLRNALAGQFDGIANCQLPGHPGDG